MVATTVTRSTKALKRLRHERATVETVETEIDEALPSPALVSKSSIVCNADINLYSLGETLEQSTQELLYCTKTPSKSMYKTYSTFGEESATVFSKIENPLTELLHFSPSQAATCNDEAFWTRLKSFTCHRTISFGRNGSLRCLFFSICRRNDRLTSTSSSNSSLTTATSRSSGTGSIFSSSQILDEVNENTPAADTIISWKAVSLISVAIAIISILGGRSCYSYMKEYKTPEWEWDRNVYIPTTSVGANTYNTSSSPLLLQTGVSLIAQMAPDKAMKRLTDISSRPNRAYARQWKMDYVKYSAGRRIYSTKSCFDNANILQTIAEKQLDDAREQQQPPSLWPHSPRVQYDSIMLLPSDAIIMNLDQNIVEQMLPQEKLVAISGWVDSKENLVASSGVVAFNLRHKYAAIVANLWWEMTQNSLVTCGATNGVSTLIQAIAIVLDDSSESLDDLIEPMKEHISGALGEQRPIKCLPSSVPGSRIEILTNSIQESLETLQQTADSVCYRFYPKCEVVP
jgi:hypothetical protein